MPSPESQNGRKFIYTYTVPERILHYTIVFPRKCMKLCSSLKNVKYQKKYSACASQRTSTIQGVSRLVDISAGGDYLGVCDQKSSYKHMSDFGRLRSYDRMKLRI
jgi:hypothetical protein